MKRRYELPLADISGIPGCCKDSAAECACGNTGCLDKTLNGYRKYSRMVALKYIRWSEVIVIIKSCLVCSKVKLIAVQSHRQVNRYDDARIDRAGRGTKKCKIGFFKPAEKTGVGKCAALVCVARFKTPMPQRGRNRRITKAT